MPEVGYNPVGCIIEQLGGGFTKFKDCICFLSAFVRDFSGSVWVTLSIRDHAKAEVNN